MNDVAAHLVEAVLPRVAIRQWVCTLPWGLRYRVGYDRALCAAVFDAFVQEVQRSYRRRAKRALGLGSQRMAQTGTVRFIQRFDSALRLTPHAHSLVLDGVYVRAGTGCMLPSGDTSALALVLPDASYALHGVTFSRAPVAASGRSRVSHRADTIRRATAGWYPLHGRA